jgi:enoyl-CoA hydratase
MATFETLSLDIDHGVATLTLERPERMNALNAMLKRELGEAFAALTARDDVACVVLTGAGRAFCAGADIKERAGQQVRGGAFYFDQQRTQDLFWNIEQFPKPLIAALNGVALGGGLELALTCDFRVAARSARVGLPETSLGMIPLAGGTQRLPRLIGASRAKRMMFTGEHVEADRAFELGVVDEVVADEELRGHVREVALGIAARAPLATRLLKRAINVGLQTDLRSALDVELLCGAVLNDSEDRHEGMRAFVEKRAPAFVGR